MGLVMTLGSANAPRNPDCDSFAALDPPFLEEMMREGLTDEEDLPLPGGA